MTALHLDQIENDYLFEQITKQVNQTTLFITRAFNYHLNLGQHFTIDTPQVLMSLETTSTDLLSNRTIKQMSHSQITFPSNISLYQNESVLIRSKLETLAPFGNSPSNTNLSRSLSISILDQRQNEISVKTNPQSPVELIIPRDPNLILPEIVLQNVPDLSFHYQLIDLQQLQINRDLTFSVHFQIQPIDRTLAYYFVYRLHDTMELNQLDGSQFFCPSSKYSFLE